MERIKIIARDDQKVFEKEVNQYLAQGWRKDGPVSIEKFGGQEGYPYYLVYSVALVGEE